jgi:hypothetical protein
MGSEMNIVHKNIDFLSSTNFKLMRQIKGNSIGNFDFFAVYRRSHCDYSPQAPKDLSMPLVHCVTRSEL